MKIILVLCGLGLLLGCNNNTNNKTTAQVDTEGKQDGLDSPIIISDGSPLTYLKHKGGTGKDFHVVNNGTSLTVTIADAGFTATKLKCVVGFGPGCADGTTTVLSYPWEIDAFDGPSGTGYRTLQIVPSDNTSTKVVTNVFATDVDTLVDASGDTNGTALAQPEHQFKSAKFTNGGVLQPVLNCPSSPCKLRIVYHN